jgi:integrase
MASLFRPTYTAIDANTGRETQRRSRKWYADYSDAEGKRRRVHLSADKAAAQAELAEILRTVERQKAGLIDQIAHLLEQPVQTHLDEYEQHLQARGRAAKHVSETIRHVRNALNESGCVVLGDLQRAEEPFDKYLAARRKVGVSYRTINADLTAIRSFCRWLIQKKRLTIDPTMDFEKLNVGLDRRMERRPLTDAEATQLLKTTLESNRVFSGLSGLDRAMLYMLAQRSGLRRGELASLVPRSFKLNADPPTVRVEAASSKHRKEDVLPLPVEVAKEFAVYLKGKHRSRAVWPGNWWRKSAEMFRVDLAAAGIAIIDADGRVLDFHGQRATFITGLARAGVSPTKAQKLARHSDVNLTMRTYTHLDVEDLASAVESLPSLRGGDGTSEQCGANERKVGDPELNRVIDSWPNLSRRTRDAIAAIIEKQLTKRS